MSIETRLTELRAEEVEIAAELVAVKQYIKGFKAQKASLQATSSANQAEIAGFERWLQDRVEWVGPPVDPEVINNPVLLAEFKANIRIEIVKLKLEDKQLYAELRVMEKARHMGPEQSGWRWLEKEIRTGARFEASHTEAYNLKRQCDQTGHDWGGPHGTQCIFCQTYRA